MGQMRSCDKRGTQADLARIGLPADFVAVRASHTLEAIPAAATMARHVALGAEGAPVVQGHTFEVELGEGLNKSDGLD